MATATASRRSTNSRSDGTQKQTPVWTKGFPVTVAVFEFPAASDDGPPNFSVQVTKAFRRDENSEYEYSAFLNGGDLLRAARLLEAADSYVQSRREEFYRSRKAERSAAENGDSF
ncbi:MAG: hypothetical protein L0228_19465 [Planctomycetes bacterium]|nr:hypothetical protein [Planctomycetota bacterium]